MRQLAAFGLAVFSMMAFGLCGCGSGGNKDGFACTASVEPALVVLVTDASTAAPAAEGATVVVTDGDYTETLTATRFTINADGSSTAIGFSGAAERAGTYTVVVTRPGYVSKTQTGVKVTRGDCHVNTQTLTIALTPQK